MNPAASSIVIESFLKGCFDVFDALFSLNFQAASEMFDAAEIQEVTADNLQSLIAEYPIAMLARLKREGAVTMLFTTQNASQFAALAIGEENAPQDTLSDTDAATLQEVASSCLGGGVSNLMDTFELGPEQLDNVQILQSTEAVEPILDLLGSEAILCPFSFNAGTDLEGSSMFLFSQDIEVMVPDTRLEVDEGGSAVDDLAASARLSEAEMSDILSGFSPDAVDDDIPLAAEPASSPAAPPPPPVTNQTNIEMVLDIKLVATARLGRVVMPISEILSLGPGSIIEVGQLVDEPIELLVNEKLIARGDVVVIDEKFGLRITEIVSPQQRIESLR